MTERRESIIGYRPCRRASRWYPVFALLCCCLLATPLCASEARIHDARTLLVEGVYRVGARIDFDLNKTHQNALRNGVPLILELQIEVLRDRHWLWGDVVAQLHQRFQLHYHTLSRRYLVDNFSSGVQFSFPKLDEALQYIGNLYDLPLIDANLLEPEEKYWVRMRANLDVESLPTPVRVWAYLGDEWSLESDWYQWPLQR